MRHDPNDAESCCEDCGETLGRCTCDGLAMLYDETAEVLAKLDDLAEVWGDEAVFRRCRDGIRKSLAKVKYERDSPSDDHAPGPATQALMTKIVNGLKNELQQGMHLIEVGAYTREEVEAFLAEQGEA